MIEMNGFCVAPNDLEFQKAKATARMIHYAACDAEELGLGECRQLLLFCTNLIRAKFGLVESDILYQEDTKSHRQQ